MWFVALFLVFDVDGLSVPCDFSCFLLFVHCIFFLVYDFEVVNFKVDFHVNGVGVPCCMPF